MCNSCQKKTNKSYNSCKKQDNLTFYETPFTKMISQSLGIPDFFCQPFSNIEKKLRTQNIILNRNENLKKYKKYLLKNKNKTINHKVFCIGFQKTGTSSMGIALEILGYNVCGHVNVLGITDPNQREKIIESVLSKTSDYNAFEDNPWCFLYKKLDKLYPGSKFILTTRDSNKWIVSMQKYFGNYDSSIQ